MKFNFMTNITRGLSKAGFELKKHSPEILAVGGTIGIVGTVVIACTATTKVSAIMEEHNKEVAQVHECLENPDIPEEKYNEEDSKKDLAIIYTKTGMKLVKLYAPAIILGAVSLTCLLSSNNILRKRSVALAAAYSIVDKNFKEYRGRVIERFGEALDHELRYDVKSKEIEETVVNEDGEEEVVKKTVPVASNKMYSDYARFFDDGCAGWTKSAEKNLYFLRQQQDWANEKLKSQGYLFLNDVYEMLGIPKSKAGQIVGWLYDPKRAEQVGDGYIEFGIYDMWKENCRDFVNGYERTILLDFNVDGNIYDLLPDNFM